jgi:hypothetical protein
MFNIFDVIPQYYVSETDLNHFKYKIMLFDQINNLFSLIFYPNAQQVKIHFSQSGQKENSQKYGQLH